MSVVTHETRGEAETRALAAQIAARLDARRGRATVIALHGPLGAGKTCFVRGLAEGLGIDPSEVSSPTFVLWHEYGPGGALVHVDAYRVADGAELEAIGFEERLEAGDAVFAIEWAERIEDLLPEDRIDVRLEHTGVDMRRVTISGSEALLPG